MQSKLKIGRLRRPAGLAVIAAAFLVAACGGGGGGGGGSGPGPHTVNGVVSSGFIGSANVTLYCGSSSGTSLGTGTTSASGAFSITVSGSCSGPIVTQAVTTSTSTMLSKLTNASYTIGAGLTLSRYDTALPASGTTTLFVTPISNLVAAAVAAANGSTAPTAQAVLQAIEATTTALGVSPAVLQAVPATLSQVTAGTVSAAQLQLYLLGAAIEQYALTSAGASGNGANAAQTATALTALNTLLSGALTPAGSGSTATITVSTSGSGALTSALNTASAGVPSSSGLSGLTAPTLALVPPTGPVTIGQASSAAAATGIVAAKTLVTNLQNDYLALWSAPATTGFFDTQDSAIRADFANANVSLKGLGGLSLVLEGFNQANFSSNTATDSVGLPYVGDNHCRFYGTAPTGYPVIDQFNVANATTGNYATICLKVRGDLPTVLDAATLGTQRYYEVVAVYYVNSVAAGTNVPLGTWQSYTALIEDNFGDPFDATVAPTVISGTSPAITGTYTATSYQYTSTTANLSATVAGSYAIFGASVDTSGNPVPDTANLNIAATTVLTGTNFNSTTAAPTISAITFSGVSGTLSSAALRATCPASTFCGFSVTSGSGSASSTGGSFSLSATLAMPDFQFQGSFGLVDNQTSTTRSVTGGLSGNTAFSGKAFAATNGTPASTPYFTGDIVLTSYNQTANSAGVFILTNAAGSLTGTVNANGNTYTLNVGVTDTVTSTTRTVTSQLTFLDPANVSVTATITSTTTTGASGKTSNTTGTITSGDTVVDLSASRTGTVNSVSAGAQIGSYSNGTVTFTDGTYLVL